MRLAFFLWLAGAAAMLAGAPTLGGLLAVGLIASTLVLIVQAHRRWWSLSPEERRAERERLKQDTDWWVW